MGYLYVLFVNSGIIKSLFQSYLVFDLTMATFIFILIALIFGILIGRRKPRNIFKGDFLVIIGAFSLFTISIIVSALYTESPLYWKEKLYRIIFLTLPSFLIPFLFFKIHDIKNFIVGSVFVYVVAISDLFYLLSKYGINAFNIRQETGLPNYLTWGGFISYNSLLFIGLLLGRKRNKVFKLFNVELIILLFALSNLFMVFIAGARGPFIFFLFAFIGMLLINKCWKIIIPVTLCVLLLIAICTSLDYSSTSLLSIGRSTRLLNLSITSTSVEKRIEYFKESWVLIKERPVLGYGIGSFSYIVSGDDQRGYPHNIFLEIWLENGIIAMIVFLIFLFSIMYLALKRSKSPFVSSFFWVNIYFIFSFMKSSSLTDARVFLAFAGILVATSYGPKIESKITRHRVKQVERQDYQRDI